MINCEVISLILVLGFSMSLASTYCYLNCETTVHDLRQLACQNSSTPPPCTAHEAVPFTRYNQLAIVHMHNTYRSLVAQGLHSKLPSTASNMKEVTWSDELQNLAREWLDRCESGPSLCKGRTATEEHGVSVGIEPATSTAASKSFGRNHLDVWYDEGVNFNRSAVNNYRFDSDTARFSQIIWADTTKIGCSAGKSLDANVSDKSVFTLVCVYGPGGNRRGKQVFEEGPIHSRCPVGFRKLSRYVGLCSDRSSSNRRLPAFLAVIVGTLSIHVLQ